MPASPNCIRPASSNDCSSLAALSIEVWISTYLREGVSGQFADYVLAHYTPEHFAAALRDPDEALLVSTNTMGIDGYIRLSQNRPGPADGTSRTEISTLYVQPRHHGSGTGKRLLEAGLKLCRQKGWDAPWLTTNSQNDPAIRFYLRNGFDLVGVTHFQIGADRYPNDIYQYNGHPAGAATPNPAEALQKNQT